MENQDPKSAVSTIVKILRKTTRVAKVVPFVYLVFFVAYMLLGNIVSEAALNLADSVLTVTPITTGFLLVCSHLFKLCLWHKTACLLPMLGQIEGYIDSFVVTFTQEEVLIINTGIGIIVLLFLFFAYKHFFAHG